MDRLPHRAVGAAAQLVAGDRRAIGLGMAFRPDWGKHGRSAPFKRNDAMLDVLPIGVLVFPGTGIQENLADKARKLGIPVMKHEGGA
jgi:hypothetical protein